MAYTTIAEMFLQTTETHPNKPLLYQKKEHEWRSLTGMDIRNAVSDIAYGMLGLNLGPKSPVVILGRNSPQWVLADYACACTGFPSVGVYTTLVQTQLRGILNNAWPGLVFLDSYSDFERQEDLWTDLHQIQHFVVFENDAPPDHPRVQNLKTFRKRGAEERKRQSQPLKHLAQKINPEDPLTIIYMQNPAGDLQGIVLSHDNVVSNLKDIQMRLPFFAEDVFLSYLPLNHAFERTVGHYAPFANGASIYYIEDLNRMARNIWEVQPTVMVGVPRFYEKLNAMVLDQVRHYKGLTYKLFWWGVDCGTEYFSHFLSGEEVSRLLRFKYTLARKFVFPKIKALVGGKVRMMICGGAALAPDITEFFNCTGLPILEGYGLTETSPVLTCNTISEMRIGTVGKALPSVELRLKPDGEILARGPNIMLGYYKDEKATAEVMDDQGWLHTGDLGEFDNDGYLTITGRKKDIIITSAGKNISPLPLETALNQSRFIDQVMVVGDRRKFISALIVPDFPALIKHLQELDVSCTDPEALVDLALVNEIIQSEIDLVNARFSHYEQVRGFILLSGGIVTEGRQLTLSLQVSRSQIEAQYREQLDRLYTGG